ncbi:hypothetical protein [Halobacteriovorax sp. DPLXC-1]|uniref:hypothetical protein n=1 Tax=Halobacteriovorax sp. DPLXC-1 TaxID=3110771 RepID=UPI002FF02C35
MKTVKTALITLSIVSSASSIAGYNQLWYMKGDIEEAYTNLKSRVRSIGGVGSRVNYFAKGNFENLCSEYSDLENEFSSLKKEFKENFLNESKNFKFGEREDVLSSIDKIDDTLKHYSELKNDCLNKSRITSERAYEVSWSYERLSKLQESMLRLKKNFNKYLEYAGMIKDYDIKKNEGAYIGHRGWKTGFKKCTVNVSANHQGLNYRYIDENRKIEMNISYENIIKEDYVDLSDEVFKDFSSEITGCRENNLFKEEVGYTNGVLTSFSIKKRNIGKTSGLGGMAKCLRLAYDDFNSSNSEAFQCYGLEKIKF